MKPIAMRHFAGRRPARAPRAFTLIELLVVISIIGVLAAFTVTVLGGVSKKKYLSNATAEMTAIETALERYKAKYGFYPPSNPNFLLATNAANFTLVQPLYFELEGVVTNVAAGKINYMTLDGAKFFDSGMTASYFGVGGLINCSHGVGEDAVLAQNFLPRLTANQVGIATNPPGATQGVAILLTSVGGPDVAYQPLGAPGLNPWRYNSINPSNNPTTYDLYVQLSIGGKKYLVCNWTKQNPINNPLP